MNNNSFKIIMLIGFALIACKTHQTLLWSKKISPPQPYSSPIFIENHLLYIDYKGGVNSIQLDNQEIKRKEFDLLPYTPVSEYQNQAYFTNASGDLLIIDENLETIETIPLSLNIKSFISFEDQILYFVAHSHQTNNSVYAYDIAQKKVIWKSQHQVTIAQGSNITIRPQELIFTGAQTLHRVNKKNGKTLAFFSLNNPEDSYQDSETLPVYKNAENIYLGSTGASIYGFSLNKKQLLWSSSLSNQVTPKVYAIDSKTAYDWDKKTRKLIARNKDDGQIHWSFPTLDSKITAIYKSQDYLLIGLDKQLVKLDTQGKVTQKTLLQDEVNPNIKAYNGKMFFFTQDFYLHCYQF